MSKGNPIVTFRMPAADLEALDQAIDRSNGFRRGAPWERGDFIRLAIRNHLKKMQRSRDWRASAKKAQRAHQAGDAGDLLDQAGDAGELLDQAGDAGELLDQAERITMQLDDAGEVVEQLEANGFVIEELRCDGTVVARRDRRS